MTLLIHEGIKNSNPKFKHDAKRQQQTLSVNTQRRVHRRNSFQTPHRKFGKNNFGGSTAFENSTFRAEKYVQTYFEPIQSSSTSSSSVDLGYKYENCKIRKFKAVRISKGDPNFNHEFTSNVIVTVDAIKRQIVIEMNKEPDSSLVPSFFKPVWKRNSSNIESKTERCNLILDWDNISGIDFQYYPLSPVNVIIEMKQIPKVAPPALKSPVYFLWVDKVDCSRCLDDVLLKNDTRIYKLAIKSLPSWSVFVNRYRIPVYYSHNVRFIVTMIVNIYIVVSLIWGFYDLYKNLPYVGTAMKRWFGPIIEPLIHNRIVLLFPLVLNRFGAIFSKMFAVFSPLMRNAFTEFMCNKFVDVIQVILWIIQYFGSFLGKFFNPIIWAVDQIRLGIWGVLVYWALTFWGFLKLPLEILKTLFSFLGIIISYLAALIESTKKFILWLWNGQLEAISIFIHSVTLATKFLIYAIITPLSLLINMILAPIIVTLQTIMYPVMKLKSLISKVDIKEAQESIEAVSRVAASASTSTQDFKEILTRFQETLTPWQRLWFGFKRIIDSIIYTWDTKIKHKNETVRRLLIASLIVSVIICFVVIIWLVL